MHLHWRWEEGELPWDPQKLATNPSFMAMHLAMWLDCGFTVCRIPTGLPEQAEGWFPLWFGTTPIDNMQTIVAIY